MRPSGRNDTRIKCELLSKPSSNIYKVIFDQLCFASLSLVLGLNNDGNQNFII